jgi:hypothetical protein
VLEYRDGAHLDSALLSWPQQWLYIIYAQVLAVVRYVAPDEALGTRLPLGITCEPLPWADSVSTARLLDIEQRANRRVEQLRAARTHPGRAIAA